MKTPHAVLVAVSLMFATLLLPAQFIAFNDSDGGEGIAHPFTTRYSLFYAWQSNYVQGPLLDISDGSVLPVQLHISGPVFTPINTTNFIPDTPATTIFGGSETAPYIVDFRGLSPRLAGTNYYTFSGLNPVRKYQLIGTANFGVSGVFTNDRTLYGIYDVDSFTSAHTSNCLTSAQISIFNSNHVILPTGRNARPGFGDMVVWNAIRPGSDGSFFVTACGYLNEMGAPFGGLRLVEDFVDPTAPYIAKQPASVSASRASTQSLAPNVSGSLPLYFQWFKDGAPRSAGTNRILRFNSLQPEDAGTYWLVTTNPYGSVTTSNVTVAVANDAMGIVAQPQNRSLRYGDLLSLSVTVTGTPSHFFQWFKDGSPLANVQTNRLQIGAANLSDAGTYFVVVSNLFSAATSMTAVVTVAYQPLSILEEPQSIIVTQGTTLRLQVAIAGSAPSFQWFKNGAALANATNSVFRVASAVTNSAGNYFVIANNQLNAVTSAVATVTIVPPLPLPPPLATFLPLALTNVWAYDQSANDLGTTWREVDYDDTSWLQGRGVLGIETSLPAIMWTNTVLRLTNTLGQPIVTSYFRTHFFWPTSSIGAALVLSNLVDDGAVFYVNGAPLFRQNMPNGYVTSSTLAPAANPQGEGVFVVTNVAAPMIIEGDNVLAVEIHQNSPTSSDIVFGTAAFGYLIPESPLTIVASPSSVVVTEAHSFELNLVLNAPANFRWYHDGVLVNGTTTGTLLIEATRPSDSGEYYAIATNSLSSVTSAVVAVQIIVDTAPPDVVNATLQPNRTTVVIDFDEPLLLASASNAANYRILSPNGTDAAMVASTTCSGTEVVLSLSSTLPTGTNFVLQLNGITDASAAGNALNNFQITLRQIIPLVPLEAVWSYNDTGNDLGTSWRASAHDDSAWPTGAALFYGGQFGTDIFPPPAFPTNTLIQLTNSGDAIITHYFRKHVDIAASPLGAQFSLRGVIDDGAVLYLNGAEVFRLGVTNNLVYVTNRASRIRGGADENSLEGPFALLPNFAIGDNVLAVELHQGNAIDAFFGAELNLVARSFPNELVRIVRQPADVFVREGQPFVFEVDSIAATSAQWLREEVAISGANTEVLSYSRAMMSDNGVRFSVLLSNDFSSVLSSNATLHVLADTNLPVLLSAAASSSTEIVLTFSEPIDPASAAVLANYLVRGSDGQVIAVTVASVLNETNIVLSTSPRVDGRNYEVRISGVTDTAAAHNEIEPGTGAALGYELTLVPLTATWTYDQSGNGQVSNWKFPGFDDGEWLVGPALLYNDTFISSGPPAPIGTLLSLTNATGGTITTHYFRHAFTLPPLDAGAELSMRYAADDSAILYLNGFELTRTNLPAGPVDKMTFAITGIEAVLSAPMLVARNGADGASVLAAETHQVTANSSDVAFAAELKAVRPSTLLAPTGPALQILRAGEQVELKWSSVNYLLEVADSPSGDWNILSNAVSPRLINPTNAAAFYRLRQP
ncbi:MAG TPA: immunoglobulin domain-containing protein [Candidatus Acidoferrum sp.]|nr:immunoglobulin domain-containing protein [Candidatus Acidoferrum sp.]